MALRIIVITDADIQGFKELAEWASKKENWYDVEAAKRGEVKAPGADKRYVRILGDMQCIFSFTVIKSEKVLYRHLSISVADPTCMPNRSVAADIARMLGFTSEGSEWAFGPGAVMPGGPKNGVILQEIPYPE